MSVVDRMHECAANGCDVDFTITGPGITTTTFKSDWWFTDTSILSSSSGSALSPDDGMWGAAPGKVQGNHGNGQGSCYGSGGKSTFYGFGNCDAGDSQAATVYYGPGGAKSCPNLQAKVYAGARAAPTWYLAMNINPSDGH